MTQPFIDPRGVPQYSPIPSPIPSPEPAPHPPNPHVQLVCPDPVCKTILGLVVFTTALTTLVAFIHPISQSIIPNALYIPFSPPWSSNHSSPASLEWSHVLSLVLLHIQYDTSNWVSDLSPPPYIPHHAAIRSIVGRVMYAANMTAPVLYDVNTAWNGYQGTTAVMNEEAMRSIRRNPTAEQATICETIVQTRTALSFVSVAFTTLSSHFAMIDAYIAALYALVTSSYFSPAPSHPAFDSRAAALLRHLSTRINIFLSSDFLPQYNVMLVKRLRAPVAQIVYRLEEEIKTTRLRVESLSYVLREFGRDIVWIDGFLSGIAEVRGCEGAEEARNMDGNHAAVMMGHQMAGLRGEELIKAIDVWGVRRVYVNWRGVEGEVGQRLAVRGRARSGSD